MSNTQDQGHGKDRPEPATGSDGAPETVEIDLERIVWDQDYRRAVTRRLGRATAAESEATPPPS